MSMKHPWQWQWQQWQSWDPNATTTPAQPQIGRVITGMLTRHADAPTPSQTHHTSTRPVGGSSRGDD